ncbi:MAG: phage tail protein [Pyrinomonadaceae bacterium]
MSSPYIGEIRMFAGNFAPAGWAFCNGALIPISENDTLFNLIGTTYGGDGQSTFALPNLCGRVPLHQGAGFVIGEMAGVESVTLTTQQLPVHTHPMLVSTGVAQGTNPAGSVVGQSTQAKLYIDDVPNVALAAQTVGPIGGNQPHENMQPYLVVSFIISLFGIFPSQT